MNIKHYQELVQDQLNTYAFPDSPSGLYDPLRYFMTLGGKRMRPVLTLMGCELFSSDLNQAVPAAISVELFHNFSLIHDDIMDQAPLRRGKETVHQKWDTNTAILSGDALLIKAYQEIAKYSGPLMFDLLNIFNQTALEVCEGQQLDMDFETMSEVEIDDYLHMITFKTAVLLGASLKMGAKVGGASEDEAQALYQFGVNLGVAFQLQDDVLDVYADQEKFGKQVGGDIIANKKTYLLLKAMQDGNDSQLKQLQQWFVETDFAKKVEGVKAIYSDLNIKEKAENKMDEYYQSAINYLNQLNIDEQKKQPLLNLAHYLMNREE